jgi:uncharacterized protein
VHARANLEKAASSAPADITVRGALALSDNINAQRSESLTNLGIDVLRVLPGEGIVVWGGRTTSVDPEWKYVQVRRIMIYLEQSLVQGLQWVVFEPNAPAIWERVLGAVGAFLASIWKSGGLTGAKPEEAYFIRCDRTTMTQDDIDNGRLVVLIGVAPLKPAEFVIFRVFCQSATH